MSEQMHTQATLDPETTAHLVQFAVNLSDREIAALQYWIGEIERETRFEEADVLAACRILHRLGFEPSWAIASLRAISSYAHVHEQPLTSTAEQIGMVMELTDMYPGELSGLLDLSEEVTG